MGYQEWSSLPLQTLLEAAMRVGKFGCLKHILRRRS